jgi:hypothetical protein
MSPCRPEADNPGARRRRSGSVESGRIRGSAQAR